MKQDFLELFEKRLQIVQDYDKECRQNADYDAQFCFWSEAQWEEELRRQWGFEYPNTPLLTSNVTQQHVNMITNMSRMNRPGVRLVPSGSQTNVESARIFEDLIRKDCALSNFDDILDKVFDQSVTGGRGYFRVITQYEDEFSFNQEIRIVHCPNPNVVYIDPFTHEVDKSDAQWGIIVNTISKEEAVKVYGEEAEGLGDSDFDTGFYDNLPEGGFQLCEYYYNEPVERTLYALVDGNSILDVDIPKGMQVKSQEEATGVEGELVYIRKRKTEIAQWWWCKIIRGMPNPVVAKQRWVGNYLPIIAMTGKSAVINGQEVYKGHVRDQIDMQKLYNYSITAQNHHLRVASRKQIIAPVEAFEGLEKQVGDLNIAEKPIFLYRSRTSSGDQIERPQPIPPPQSAPGFTDLGKLAMEGLKDATGQYNASMGDTRRVADSGKAINALKTQGDLATAHNFSNRDMAVKLLYKVLIDLYPKIYDVPMIKKTLGIDDTIEEVTIDPNIEGAIVKERGEDGKIRRIFNPAVGKYDIIIMVGANYSSQREVFQEQMLQLAKVYPPLMDVASDLVIGSLPFEAANVIAKRMRSTMAPNVLQAGEENEDAQTKALEQKLQEGTQVVMQLQQRVQELQAELDKKINDAEIKNKIEMAKVDIDKYNAETKRIQVINDVNGGVAPIKTTDANNKELL